MLLSKKEINIIDKKILFVRAQPFFFTLSIGRRMEYLNEQTAEALSAAGYTSPAITAYTREGKKAEDKAIATRAAARVQSALDMD